MENKENSALEKVQNIIKENNQEISVDEKRKEKERQRQERLLKREKIKEERAKEKRQKRQQKLKWKEEQKDAKFQLKEQKQKFRQENKRSGRNVSGWITAVVTLGTLSVLLTSALTYNMLMPKESDRRLESAYSKSFYDTVEQVNNMDLNLSKALASKDSVKIQEYLLNTAINSELCENDLQQLPINDENKYYTTKLVNQIGDYSKYLIKSLSNGDDLSLTQYQTLKTLYEYNKTFKNSLYNILDFMEEGYSFTEMSNNSLDDLVISNFNELQNISISYPELIYDGPFSDGLDDREVKGLSGEQTDENQALEIAKSIYKKDTFDSAKIVGETEGVIPCYNCSIMENGKEYYMQISKMGGKLIMYSFSGNCNSVVYSQDQAIEKGQNFLSEINIDNMKAVWADLVGNVYTINYAYLTNGVITYPDMIKVRVCAESLDVIGVEASAYYINHTERAIGKATLTSEQAKKYLSVDMQVNSERLVIVPIGNSSEKLCYEFNGVFDGETYYTYIDANSGKQVEMFRVIKNTEGQLLM